jgi:multicomponent Na+:H+ antiporter subunit B
MKPLSSFGILIVIFLIALSIYVIEDLPAFGDENSPANKYMMLFSLQGAHLEDSLKEGIVPPEIKDRIDEIGFNAENVYPTLEEGNYEIAWNEENAGWDVLIKEGEIYYKEPIKYYCIKVSDGNLAVLRYNWPIRVLERTEEETATPNAVTSGLADYRGYDTMGEETVILTGAIAVTMLLRRRGVL